MFVKAVTTYTHSTQIWKKYNKIRTAQNFKMASRLYKKLRPFLRFVMFFMSSFIINSTSLRYTEYSRKGYVLWQITKLLRKLKKS